MNAPVTRPDLDARLHEIAERGDEYKDEDGGFLIDHEDAETVREAVTALAAERARADQAEQQIAPLQEQGGWSCLHCGQAAEAHSLRGHPSFQCVWEPYWKSAAPTAEQEEK